MDLERIKYLIAKYDGPVPRYTSFPTAVQFHEGFSQSDLGNMLYALPQGQGISLYVHIPFCHALCHYCGCNTKVVGTDAPVKAYVALLLREIELVARKIRCRLPVTRIHFGGGSPNFAPPESLAAILAAFDTYFELGAQTQIDMECDPRLLTRSKIEAYAALGVKRVSLGIQDFNAEVQRAVNRIQPYDDVRRHMDDLRDCGIEDINFDLIIGLPAQTTESVEETLAQTLKLEPSRIAVFPYAHVPWMKKHQLLLEKYERPDPLTRYLMNDMVHETLLRSGYGAIGIDHYAREGDALLMAARAQTMHRNFQGYTDDDAQTLLGLGLSSISQFDGAFSQNTTDAPTYRKAIEQGYLPVARGLLLGAEDKIRRAVIERIMCRFSLNFSDFPQIKPPRDALSLLAQDGLLILKEDGFEIPPEGRTFARLAAACYDPYFNAASGRHAKAV